METRELEMVIAGLELLMDHAKDYKTQMEIRNLILKFYECINMGDDE